MVRSGSPLQRRLFLLFLPILLQVSPHTLWGGENNPHPQKVSSQQVRTLARGPFTLPLENNGVIVSTKGNYLRWYGQDLVTGAALMIVGKDETTGALHSSLGGPYTDSENQAGVLTAPYTGNSSVAANPADPRFRIYAIQRTDATGGGNLDYDQWPADQGAPVGTDGKPLFLGDQEFFFVYNDLATLSRSPGGLPFGIEVRVLGWWDDQIPLLSGTFFYRFQILNKSIFAYDSIFVGVWADPDIGSEYHDDFVGCDTTLRLLYAYKDVEQDPSAYGMSPPSVGFLFLGIEQPGGLPGKNLFHFVPITRASGGDFPDVGLHSLDFHQLVYNYLRGLGARGQTVLNPLTGLGSTSVFPGDPVTGLGWLPKNSGFTPTDYRMMGSCGPLRMAPGDTQMVTVALIAAQGQDRLGSVAQLRFIAEQIRAAFASSTQPAINAEPSWWMEYPSGSPPRAHVTVNTAGIQTCTAEFFDGQGQTILSSLMTGSGTFSTVSELPALRPAYGDLVALRPQGVEVRYRGAFNRLSTAARPEQRRLQVTYDQSNGDLIANPGELIELSMSLFNGSLWTFDSLTLEPSFLSATRAFKSMSFRGLPSGQETPLPEAIAATVDGSSGEIGQAILPFVLVDHIWSNRWYDTLRIPVQPFNYLPKPVYPIHVSGKSSRTPLISLVNPSGWKDHEYSITFPLSIYNIVVVDMTTNDSLVRNQSFGPYVYYSPRVLQPGDAGRLVIDGFKLLPGNIGSADVEMRELCGPGGIVLESEPYERNARFGRDLRKERENSTNRYRLSDVSLSYDNPIIELRTTERGSKYYVGLSPDTAIRLAPNRVPFEIWNLGGTPDDPSDDKQLTVIVFDGDRDGRFTASESIIGTQMYAYSESPPESHQVINWFFDRNIVLRFKPASGDQFALPEEGAVLRFYWSVPVGPDDIYLVRPAQASLPPPSSVFLFNNFPNPFNPTTTIKFYLPVKSKVKVTVYDLLGAEVAVLLDEERDVGEHYAFWGGKNRSGMSVASGVYLYRVSTPSTTTAGKMILLR